MRVTTGRTAELSTGGLWTAFEKNKNGRLLIALYIGINLLRGSLSQRIDTIRISIICSFSFVTNAASVRISSYYEQKQSMLKELN